MDAGRQRRSATARRLVLSIGLVGCLALPAVAGGADPGRVAGCRPFTVFKGYSEYTGRFNYRASSVRRSTAISCYMSRKLLRAAYGGGPLHVVRTVYEHDSQGRRFGRPTYWLRGGWRCGNGAGGASCWNAQERQFNAIPLEGLTHGLAVTANVGFVG